MQNHPVVSQQEWLAARRALLVKEKQATQLRDRLNGIPGSPPDLRDPLPGCPVERQRSATCSTVAAS